MIRHRRKALGMLAIVFTLLPPAVRAEAPIDIAVFPFELIDSSLGGELEGESEADRRRLAMIEAELKRQIEDSGRYRVIETGEAADAIAEAGSLNGCRGCEAPIAKRLGADQALIGWVQKVSNLILNLNVGIRAAATKRKVFAASVDIRGNTDESWRHGIRYLVKRKLFNDNSKIERD